MGMGKGLLARWLSVVACWWISQLVRSSASILLTSSTNPQASVTLISYQVLSFSFSIFLSFSVSCSPLQHHLFSVASESTEQAQGGKSKPPQQNPLREESIERAAFIYVLRLRLPRINWFSYLLPACKHLGTGQQGGGGPASSICCWFCYLPLDSMLPFLSHIVPRSPRSAQKLVAS